MESPKELHDQIIHFIGGVKRTIKDVYFVEENEMTHLYTMDGKKWIINKSNVLCVEIIFTNLKSAVCKTTKQN